MKFFQILKKAFTTNIPCKLIALLLAILVTLAANIMWLGL